MNSPIISAAALQDLIQQGADVRVLDCTFHLDNVTLGRASYETQHIAGALYADLDADLSAHDATQAVNGGRHPLPKREVFAQTLGRWGITPETLVVAYDNVGTLTAGRLWWMLRWCGHARVQVLDGGWPAWQAIGGAVASGAPPAIQPAADYPLGQALETLFTHEQVLSQLGKDDQTLVDARGAPRYRGEAEPLDPVAGHIPGALNRPYPDNFDAQGCFKSPEVLRAEWLGLLGQRGSESVVAYCGSGVSAVPNLISLRLAGLPAKGLYGGSWSEWSRAGLPCAQG